MAQCKTKYTTLLDLSRQAKIITGDTACFDGKIQAGIPFSGYPTGVDLSTVVETGILDSQSAIFSGNTGTTVFDVANPVSPNYSPIFSGSTYSGKTWTDPVFSANTTYLTLPITILSAETQNTPISWTLTQTGMTGEYVIGTEYTGYSVSYSFNSIQGDGGFPNQYFTGETTGTKISYSAQSLDYKGPLDYISSKENITVENRLTTKKLQVTNGADASTIGYVLKQADSEGNVEWGPDTSGGTSTDTFVTGGTLSTDNNLTLTYNLPTPPFTPINLSQLNFTGNTSGNCIDEFWVNNISGCTTDDLNIGVGAGQELNINSKKVNLLFDDNDVTSFVVNNTNSGIEARSTYSLICDGLGGFETSGSLSYIGPNYNSAGTFQGEYLPNSLNLSTGGGGPAHRANINIGSRATTGETRFFSGGDNFEESTYLGKFSPDGLYVKGDVGIGTDTPTEKLHVSGGDILIETSNGKFYSDLDSIVGPAVRLSGNSADLITLGVADVGVQGMNIGTRGDTEPSYPGYGKQGDGFLYSSAEQNGLNIISQDGTNKEDYIRFYAGKDADGTTPDIHIQGTGSTKGYVGIGTDTPLNILHVEGNILVANQSGSAQLTLSGSGVSDAAINFDNTGSATPFSQIIGQTFGAGASGNIEFNTNPGGGLTKRMTISTGGRVGIGNINNNDIEEELHVYDGDFLIERSGGRFSSVLDNVSGPIVRLSADSSDTLVSINVASPNRGGIGIGARGLTDVGFPGYGKVGDGYIYSTNDQNGLNIISSAGAGLEDYIRMYAGQDAVGTADLYIQGTGATRGFVGIHTETPTTELDVDGDVNISGSLTVGSQVIGNTTTVDSLADPNVNGINVVFYSSSGPGGTITLNSAMNIAGYKVELVRTSTTAAAVISGGGGALINGAGTKALPTTVYSTTTCISDGTDWYCTNGTIL